MFVVVSFFKTRLSKCYINVVFDKCSKLSFFKSATLCYPYVGLAQYCLYIYIYIMQCLFFLYITWTFSSKARLMIMLPFVTM